MLPHSRKKKILLLCLICFVPAFFYICYLCRPIYYPNEPSVTSWGAPIVWHGSFNRTREDELHRAQGTVIGLSVFAVGKYIPRYLGHFLETAELYFMPGYSVVYYVMVDNFSLVPKIHLLPNRSMVVTKVEKHDRWQEISMMRMRDIIELVVPRAKTEVNFLFCMDVDQEFTSHYGVETLSDLVAQIHSYHYLWPKFMQSFETNPASAAYVDPSKSDYYYHAATFAGTVPEILKLAKACLEGIWRDKEKGIEAIFQEESHLNHYLLHTKPTKVLSPEYNWDGWRNVKYPTLRWMPKDYRNLRENPA
ncbi:hypothetical protein NDU88_001028 [Pleurodeles waltl]|uniref:Uncharacterized protein n=1 Tax=Pleurodeles waltl TaxID=8319 RepID=A0AAV7Q1X6_PLEWA|nr:hypothetical protein NDU88_001028 [Pleurodeles waltl]